MKIDTWKELKDYVVRPKGFFDALTQLMICLIALVVFSFDELPTIFGVIVIYGLIHAYFTVFVSKNNYKEAR